MRVNILTYCQDLAQLYGATLIFETLRVGFPTAEVRVYDNGSIWAAHDAIRVAATETGCDFVSLEREWGVTHDQWLRERIMASLYVPGLSDPMVICDPDVVFWSNFEDNVFPDNVLLAGRRIRRHHDVFGMLQMPRLHPSLWWIPNARRLAAAIAYGEKQFVVGDQAYLDMLRPVVVPFGNERLCYDTGAVLTDFLDDRIYIFDPDELDRYDHLFAGTHANLLPAAAAALAPAHDIAKSGDLSKLRGIWRQQEANFRLCHEMP